MILLGILMKLNHGIIVWAVLPILLTSRIKRKSDRKAVTLICKILGAFLVLWGLYNLIF